MRKVIYAINITLDGCCDHTKGIADDELLAYYTQLVRGASLLAYGRKTYELMVPYWPDIARTHSESQAENDFADAFDAARKAVFSRSLSAIKDKNTRLLRGNLRDEMAALKQEPGSGILVGGVSLPSQLIELGLVDEFRFVVAPVLAGGGRRLLDGASLPQTMKLRLVESKPLRSGCVALHYVRP
ncbi:MAG: dihydrofolate reductase [Acidobacteria bacterium]|nr:MAG: dihydrofolate reductase [Acidobacteriota bacterium]